MKTNDNLFLYTYISTPFKSLPQGKFQLPCTRHTIFTSFKFNSYARALLKPVRLSCTRALTYFTTIHVRLERLF